MKINIPYTKKNLYTCFRLQNPQLNTPRIKASRRQCQSLLISNRRECTKVTDSQGMQEIKFSDMPISLPFITMHNL